ncbi:unnamed protein product [Cuscuta europaea]|uniref:Uncharacterized protein n=1 Tax=Cuscuta europaea TaxID=41803 RepID=A0A9P1EI81_CUSEU|nr:unnamed protein product [Cuscuta europaea]
MRQITNNIFFFSNSGHRQMTAILTYLRLGDGDGGIGIIDGRGDPGTRQRQRWWWWRRQATAETGGVRRR